MKRLHCIKEKLIDCVECQMEHLDTVDAKELGEAIDMIKDISETMYYCAITNAMKGEEYAHDSDRPVSAHHGDGPAHHPRDSKEGKSYVSRKGYMESKEAHKDKSVMLQELEKYMQELAADLVEMIEDSTPEEKQYLSNRLATLATKIK